MNDETQKLFPWDEGLPIKPDVDLLLKQWPNPQIGDRFEYATIERLLHLEWKSARFRTVTRGWCAQLLKLHSVVIHVEAATAFYVASGQQIQDAIEPMIKFTGRKYHRHRVRVATVTPANDTQRTQLEHQGRLLNILERDTKKARMNLLPPTAAASLPQIAPPMMGKRK
jgi:hypothetical protein